MEFAGRLPSPTSIVTLGMKPVDGSAVLEINPSLVFPILEMLLGGSGKLGTDVTREVTEIEQSILEGLLHVILHDLRASWHAVTALEFSIDSHETEPQLLQILAPNEAVVAISLEVRIGDRAGMMNIGIPSIVVKRLRQKFDQQWSVRKTKATEKERTRVLRLIRPAILQTDVRLHGPTLGVGELLELREGDVLAFDYPLAKPVDMLVNVNGKLKYRGDVVATTRKLALEVRDLVTEE